MNEDVLKLLLMNIKEDGERQKVIDSLNKASNDVKKISMDALRSKDGLVKDSAIVTESLILLSLIDVVKEMTNNLHDVKLDISKKIIEEMKGKNDEE